MTVRILCGDSIERLRELPADSVHCVVTSPPYWGLRDYGTGTWEGGDPDCDHQPTRQAQGANTPFRETCRRCGARRIDQQIGLEPTPDAWAARLVEVFREVRRVLRPDGVCFVNCGDSYANTGCGGGSPVDARTYGNGGGNVRGRDATKANRVPAGLKPKDLIGQPWLLAFALRADGWWLRSEIIWSKPNPMPESVTDRPTKAHEQVFLLTKSARYFWDAEAVREAGRDWGERDRTHAKHNGEGFRAAGQPPHRGLTNGDASAGRNLRSVWQIATEPFPEAHFATFPTELARRCILAGTSAKGCCPACGAPWARVVERSKPPQVDPSELDRYGTGDHGVHRKIGSAYQKWLDANPRETLDWRPSCSCDAGEPTPCTVLDPFGGSGTTGMVADQLGRDAVLIELSPDYAAMAERRISSARARRLLGDAPRDVPLPGQLSLLP